MDEVTAMLWTLGAYGTVLLVLGVVAQRRTRTEADYLLGGRKLGAFVAGISASASSSSAWTLLGVSGYAYARGVHALWLFPACVGGFVLNWVFVAPRLRRLSSDTGALTVIELLSGRHRGREFGPVRLLAVAILVFSLMLYVSAQLHATGKSFAAMLEVPRTAAVLIGAGIVVAYTVVGGLWAVSLTDTVQGSAMALAAIIVPIGALVAVGGPAGLAAGIAEVPAEGFASALRGLDGVAAVWPVLALLGIGLGYPGQPHVVNFFMSVRDDRQLRMARLCALTWAVIVYAGMILLGLSARVLHPDPVGPFADPEQAFFGIARELFPPLLGGFFLAAVLSAIMSTVDSQLLVVGTSVTHDLLPPGADERRKLRTSRGLVLAVAVVAVVVALGASETLFVWVLFAWTALGAAFGPLILVTLWRGPVGARRSLVAMAAGFVLAVAAYAWPPTRGTAAERVLPFVAAFGCLLAGRGRP